MGPRLEEECPVLEVAVEVLLLRDDPDGGLHHRWERGALREGEHPDDGALRVARSPSAPVSHSTSWRFELPDVLVLTYAVLPDPWPSAPATPLTAPAVVCSGDAAHPTPPLLHAHHVAAHAVRHLAYLAEHDPTIAAVAEDSGLWAAIRSTAEGMPVGTHGEAHRMADREGADARPLPAQPRDVAGQPLRSPRGNRPFRL